MGLGTFLAPYGISVDAARVHNLLPIPALNRGYVMFLLYEMITGREASERFFENPVEDRVCDFNRVDLFHLLQRHREALHGLVRVAGCR